MTYGRQPRTANGWRGRRRLRAHRAGDRHLAAGGLRLAGRAHAATERRARRGAGAERGGGDDERPPRRAGVAARGAATIAPSGDGDPVVGRRARRRSGRPGGRVGAGTRGRRSRRRHRSPRRRLRSPSSRAGHVRTPTRRPARRGRSRPRPARTAGDATTPKTAPRASATTTIPTISAGLSLVPNSVDGEVLQRAGEAVDELGADRRHQRRALTGEAAHQLADAEGDAGGDGAGERGRDAAGAGLEGGGHGIQPAALIVTDAARRAQRSRNSRSAAGQERAPVVQSTACRHPPAAHRPVSLTRAPPSPAHRPRARVLVVDDEPMVREVVARYLELDGFRVHEAADGTAARELAGRPPARPRRARHHAARAPTG